MTSRCRTTLVITIIATTIIWGLSAARAAVPSAIPSGSAVQTPSSGAATQVQTQKEDQANLALAKDTGCWKSDLGWVYPPNTPNAVAFFTKGRILSFDKKSNDPSQQVQFDEDYCYTQPNQPGLMKLHEFYCAALPENCKPDPKCAGKAGCKDICIAVKQEFITDCQTGTVCHGGACVRPAGDAAWNGCFANQDPFLDTNGDGKPDACMCPPNMFPADKNNDGNSDSCTERNLACSMTDAEKEKAGYVIKTKGTDNGGYTIADYCSTPFEITSTVCSLKNVQSVSTAKCNPGQICYKGNCVQSNSDLCDNANVNLDSKVKGWVTINGSKQILDTCGIGTESNTTFNVICTSPTDSKVQWIPKPCGSSEYCDGGVCKVLDCVKTPDDPQCAAKKPEPPKETCGDGTIQLGLGEECDGKNLNGLSCESFGTTGTLLCTAQCKRDKSGCKGTPPPKCGNGKTDAGEACDDGNAASGDGCSATCKKEICGDGVVQFKLGEECDGNNLNGISCASSGKMGNILCTSQCKLDKSGCKDDPCKGAPEAVCAEPSDSTHPVDPVFGLQYGDPKVAGLTETSFTMPGCSTFKSLKLPFKDYCTWVDTELLPILTQYGCINPKTLAQSSAPCDWKKNEACDFSVKDGAPTFGVCQKNLSKSKTSAAPPTATLPGKVTGTNAFGQQVSHLDECVPEQGKTWIKKWKVEDNPEGAIAYYESCPKQNHCEKGICIPDPCLLNKDLIDDKDPCTKDSCDEQTGDVFHLPIPVDDNNNCTSDKCVNVGGQAKIENTPLKTDVCILAALCEKSPQDPKCSPTPTVDCTKTPSNPACPKSTTLDCTAPANASKPECKPPVDCTKTPDNPVCPKPVKGGFSCDDPANANDPQCKSTKDYCFDDDPTNDKMVKGTAIMFPGTPDEKMESDTCADLDNVSNIFTAVIQIACGPNNTFFPQKTACPTQTTKGCYEGVCVPK